MYNIKAQIPFLQTNTIANIFADKFYSTAYLLDVFDLNMRNLAFSQERIFEISRRWEQLDVCVFMYTIESAAAKQSVDTQAMSC